MFAPVVANSETNINTPTSVGGGTKTPILEDNESKGETMEKRGSDAKLGIARLANGHDGAVAESKGLDDSSSSELATTEHESHSQDLYDSTQIDPVYHAKARLLGDAMDEIGMGKYQVSISQYAY